MVSRLKQLIVCAVAGAALTGCAMNQTRDSSLVRSDIDWPAFIARQSIEWDELPKRWLDAPFLGNGMMGTMVFQTGQQTVRWQVGRGDVQDHRPFGDERFPGGAMYLRNRLPIGHLELNTAGKITGGSMVLDLYHAEARGVIATGKGTIKWRSFVPTDPMAIVTETEPSEGEAGCQWVWHAAEAVSPRQVFKNDKRVADYPDNPDPVESTRGDIHLCTQPLLVGGETVTAWIEYRDKETAKRRLVVSVAQTHPESGAADEAIAHIQAARSVTPGDLLEAHRAWWRDFYPQSFVSIPDAYWQQFYWMQMYKLASATRADRMLLDLNGPWLQRTPWPGIWWNLNVQLTYWPTYVSNRLGLGASLGHVMYANVQNLIDTVPEQYRHDSAAVGGATGQDLLGSVTPPNGKNKPQMGLLLWALHNCYLHYRHSMDDATLREHLYPLLKRAVNYYFHFLTEDADGVLHIPQTWSPEYKAGQGPDTNFDLALVRWGCTALIESADRLRIDDPLLPRWRDTLRRLAPYPVNENGYMIAAGVPFATRHRHFSHLLMLYPLYLVNADQPGAAELAIRSTEHWQSYKPWHGYSFTGSSSLFSAFGEGDKALHQLNGLKKHVSVTTMYSEIGPWAQCIETPLSAAQSIHDMLLQSWGHTIRVFPAAPSAWGDIAFHNLRAEGAFLVSAKRTGGQTQWVRLKSLAGEPCRVKLDMPGEMRVTGRRAFQLEPLGGDTYSLDLQRGEEALLYTGDAVPRAIVRPVPVE
jgi:alpha-L-fucosidase 2